MIYDFNKIINRNNVKFEENCANFVLFLLFRQILLIKKKKINFFLNFLPAPSSTSNYIFCFSHMCAEKQI